MGRHYQVFRNSDSEPLVSNCSYANGAWERMQGLLGKSGLKEKEGLWIPRCNSVHTFFMKFVMDAVFVDRAGKIVALYSEMKPWRMSWIHFNATAVLELPAGFINKHQLSKSDVLRLESQ